MANEPKLEPLPPQLRMVATGRLVGGRFDIMAEDGMSPGDWRDGLAAHGELAKAVKNHVQSLEKYTKGAG